MTSPAVRWLSADMGSVPDGNEWLSPREAAWAAQMEYPKRRLEYRMARWCAKSAVASTFTRAPEFAAIEIGHLPEGAPAANVLGDPFPLRISMTDRADWAVCAIAPTGVEVGCDLELVEPRSVAFVRDYFVPEEEAVALVDGTADPLLANLIWSAKESALKVLRTGLRRDTRTVVVELGEARDPGWQPLTVRSTEGDAFPGWWRQFGPFVLTVACSEPTSAPESLADPPGLASAAPGHSWMETPQP